MSISIPDWTIDLPGLGTVPLIRAARWHQTFNSFGWPSDYPVPKPDGWDALTARQRHDSPAMCAEWARLSHPIVAQAARSLGGGSVVGRPGDEAGLEPTARESGGSWRDRPAML